MAKQRFNLSYAVAGVQHTCSLSEIGEMQARGPYYSEIHEEYISVAQYNRLSEYRKEYFTEVYDWNSEDMPTTACFACTNHTHQSKEEKELSKAGFRKVASYRNSAGQTVNMWFKKPRGQRW